MFNIANGHILQSTGNLIFCKIRQIPSYLRNLMPIDTF